MSYGLSLLCKVAVLPGVVASSRLCRELVMRIGPKPGQCFWLYLLKIKLSACLFAQAVTARLAIKSQHGQGRQGNRVLWCAIVLVPLQSLIRTARNAERAVVQSQRQTGLWPWQAASASACIAVGQ